MVCGPRIQQAAEEKYHFNDGVSTIHRHRNLRRAEF